MTDIVVRRYDLPVFDAGAKVASAGIIVRRALAPEGHIVIDWIGSISTQDQIERSLAVIACRRYGRGTIQQRT